MFLTTSTEFSTYVKTVRIKPWTVASGIVSAPQNRPCLDEFHHIAGILRIKSEIPILFGVAGYVKGAKHLVVSQIEGQSGRYIVFKGLAVSGHVKMKAVPVECRGAFTMASVTVFGKIFRGGFKEPASKLYGKKFA